MDISTQLTNIIINSSDPEELKNKIIKEIAIALNASQCFFVEYDLTTHNFKKINNLYSAKRDASSLLGYDIENNLKYLSVKLKYMKFFIIEDTDSFIKNNQLENTNESQYFKDFNVKAFLAVRLAFGETFSGILAVNYDEKKRNLQKTDLLFLKDTAEHISIALHLSTLYTEEKSKGEREKLLSSIVSIMGESYDLEKINQKIFAILGKVYNARSIFVNVDTDNFKKFYFYNFSKYKPNEFKDYEKNDLFNIYNFHYFDSIKNKSHYISNTHHFIISNNLENTSIEKYFNKNNIKSVILLPILHEFLPYGLLIIHFDITNPIAKDDLELLQTITTQLGMVIKQVLFYEREKSLRKIIEVIGSTLNISEMKQKVITAIAEALNANRCYIAEIDENDGKYIPISHEYVASSDIKSILGYDLEQSIPELIDFVKKKSIVLIPDADEFIESNNFSDTIKNYFSNFDIKSRVYLKITYKDIFFGTLIVNFPEKREKFNKEDVDFIETLAHQIGITMYQAKLYNYSQLQVTREKILGTIFTKSISTFDINQIKPIVREVGILAKADRCYFVEAKEEELSGKPIYHDGEYLASPDVKSATGYTFPAEDVQKFVEMYVVAKDLIVFDYEEILKNTDEQLEGMRRYIRYFGLKSGIGIPLFYKGKLHAVLAIEYAKEKVLPTEDELKFYRLLGKQAGMLLNQIKLFENTKKTAEKEALIRNITEKIRSSLDIQKTLSFICEETAKLFNVQRAAISEMFPPYNSGNFIPRKEYKSNESIKGLSDVFYPKEVSAYITVTVLDKGINLVINNFEKADVPDYFKKAYREMGVKAALCVPIKKDNNKWGTIFLAEYNYYRDWTDDEINLLEIIAGQTYIAIKQAELYEITRKQADREILLRKITEAIRSSLDINETLSLICQEITKVFNVQRTAIGTYSEIKNYSDFSLMKEYKVSPEFRGFTDIQTSSNVLQIWEEVLINKGEILAIDNIMESTYPDNFKEAYNNIGVKSLLGIAIKKKDDVWGTLVLSDYTEYRNWNDEDKKLLQDITAQIYIALHQAELYENEKVLVEREKISRNIIEILRSSIDKTIIKKLFVKNIGKFFDAGRVLLSEYDHIKKQYLPADENAEYLADPNEKSLKGFDWSTPEMVEFISPLLEKRELNIYCWDEYIQQNPKGKDFINFFESHNIKSSYNFPITYQQNLMGFFCIDFINEVRRLSEEEISRIRNMSSQAGIALYHAELYKEAQQCLLSKKALASEVYEQVKKPAHEILDTSTLLCKKDFERAIEIEYLNKIINSCNQILELTTQEFDV